MVYLPHEVSVQHPGCHRAIELSHSRFSSDADKSVYVNCLHRLTRPNSIKSAGEFELNGPSMMYTGILKDLMYAVYSAYKSCFLISRCLPFSPLVGCAVRRLKLISLFWNFPQSIGKSRIRKLQDYTFLIPLKNTCTRLV